MKISVSVKQIVVGVIIVAILAFIFIGRYKYRRETDRLSAALYDAQGVVRQSEATILKQKIYISTADVQIVSSQSAIKKLEEEKAYLKKLHINDVKSITKLELQIDILQKQGVYRDTIIVRDTITNDIDTVRQANYKDQWVTASVLLYPDKPVFSISLYSPVKVWIGYTGILRPKATVAVTTTNPYISITKNQTIIVEDKKKLLQKRYPYLLVGGVIGFLIAK